MKNGQTVAAFEKAFAEYVGARYAIALVNGTATLHTALAALGVKPGDRVVVPPLTMSATAIAVLHAGAVPVFVDVDADTWVMPWHGGALMDRSWCAAIPVSLYGLCSPARVATAIDDAAQTLRKHSGCAFTSYSFQASKILSLGEGGMLVTDDEALATKAREFSSLGYRMRADQPRIDPDALKSPTFDRHYSLGFNYRMNDLTAAAGLRLLEGPTYTEANHADALKRQRRDAAVWYRNAIADCDWLTPQYVPEGWQHDYWSWAVACDISERAVALQAKMAALGAEVPYGCWKLTYREPAFRHLVPQGVSEDAKYTVRFDEAGEVVGVCPVAESLQSRILAFQTNDLASAERNATALWKAIEELS